MFQKKFSRWSSLTLFVKLGIMLRIDFCNENCIWQRLLLNMVFLVSKCIFYKFTSFSNYWHFYFSFSLPSGIQLFKNNSGNTRTMREICSELTIKTPESRLWHRSNAFIVNFEQVSNIVLIFPLLTLNKFLIKLQFGAIWSSCF